MGEIVRRHWDQPCNEELAVNTFVTIEELFDTADLGRELIESGLSFESTDQRDPTLSYVTRYRRDGSVSASGVWESTFSPATVADLARILSRRVQPLSDLLVPEGFHTRLEVDPTPRMEVRPPIYCAVHIVHEDNKPPTGLPEGVRTWIGRLSRNAGDSTVRVLINVDAEGNVGEVEMLEGSEIAYQSALGVIPLLSFDPAARNGESVDGRLRLSFIFSR